MDDILNILRKNAAMPVEKIALLVNQTSDEVEEKIKGWESDGTILGYTTVINTDKLEDESLVMAMIEVKITPEREGGFDKIARRIARFSEVKSCYLMSGGFDLLVMVEGFAPGGRVHLGAAGHYPGGCLHRHAFHPQTVQATGGDLCGRAQARTVEGDSLRGVPY